MFRREEDGVEFLLIRDPYENWGLPKGHIEGGETPDEAALREVEEETGLSRIMIVAPLPTIDWYFRDRGKLVHKFCHFFLIECVAGAAVPQLDEGITACIWRTPADAMALVSYANAREVMQAAADLLAQESGDATAGVAVEGGRQG